ncbi:transcriptional regulator [Actinomadura darangshiensis]|uniref:Transcriptional regulator n=1 Tax=Actinomadura darangshiensis TaxID=705336 RepID=A0A4R5B3K3_9ACTN|nr:helix-turn-helix transcriptional regulator [Actinomadura darangshiensis]TDD80748.1 transcriptional regulator [Actinomadura darangshiensis]
MLHIHFTAEDLGRTRLATGPEPMWEMLLSLHKLTDNEGRVVFDGWRRRVRTVDRTGLPMSARWLPLLAPPVGYSPDFLTPARQAGDLGTGLDLVLATPRRRLRHDLTTLAAQQPLRGPVAELADGSKGALHQLGRALRDYHAHALAPFWDRIRTDVHADLTTRGKTFLHSGIEAVLTGLHPGARWNPPVLELPYSRDHHIHLDGRGVRLLPSFFCWGRPFTFHDPVLPPVIAYPIEHDLAWTAPRSPRDPGRPLAALLGRTRTAVLTTVAAGGGCTTTELARRTGISLASASQHTGVLRDAGLITTVRRGGHVVHSLRPAGAALIHAPAGRGRPR